MSDGYDWGASKDIEDKRRRFLGSWHKDDKLVIAAPRSLRPFLTLLEFLGYEVTSVTSNGDGYFSCMMDNYGSVRDLGTDENGRLLHARAFSFDFRDGKITSWLGDFDTELQELWLELELKEGR